MKKTTKIISLILISIFVTLTIFGCNSSASATKPSAGPAPVTSEIRSDKTEYALGEEITIEILFSALTDGETSNDDYTYCLKLVTSDYYEIIGDDVVSAEAAEEDELFAGKNDTSFKYRATFKIKVTEETTEEQKFVFYINRVENDDLRNYPMSQNLGYSDDPEYDLKIYTRSGFTADSDGVHFPEMMYQYQAKNNKLPFWYGAILFLDDLIKAIKEFFAGLFI